MGLEPVDDGNDLVGGEIDQIIGVNAVAEGLEIRRFVRRGR